jgi:hypothetical protein
MGFNAAACRACRPGHYDDAQGARLPCRVFDKEGAGEQSKDNASDDSTGNQTVD